MNSVDEFVIYDNIEFTKKGWINRNRILVNGEVSYISIPLKKDSDYLNISERYLAETWIFERDKIVNRIIGAYKKSPNFNLVYPVIEKCILFEERNLFKYVFNSLILIKEYLEIHVPLIISSTIPIDHTLKAEKKVINICKSRKANIYFNPIGGLELYNKNTFKEEGIVLRFLKTNKVSYKQFNNEFIPYLSILDVMMFNSKEEIKELLKLYELG